MITILASMKACSIHFIDRGVNIHRRREDGAELCDGSDGMIRRVRIVVLVLLPLFSHGSLRPSVS